MVESMIEAHRRDAAPCRWSSRINLREYCATCSWGTRFGCQLIGKKPSLVKHGPVKKGSD